MSMSPPWQYNHEDPYLNKLYTAMQYNPDTGEPEIRVSLSSGDVVISGPITIPGEIEINNNTGNPIPVSANTTTNGAGNPIYVNVTNGTLSVTQGTDPWNVSGQVSISGTVDIGTMPEVEIKNDSGNPIPVTSDYNVFTVGFNPVQTDAFGRFRISEPYTLFDSFHRFQDNGKFTEFTANGGTSSYNASAGTVSLNVTTTANSEVIRESSKVFAYQPGKSLLVLQTYCMGPAQPNLRIRHGYYDVGNGFYIQRDGSQISLVKRSSSSGSIVDTPVNQSAWNVDPMDGNGPSGITLDFTKSQIMWHDLEWLGVGTVRVGFVVNGQFYPVHYWNHANIITTTYMTTACLPVRAEIKATNTLSASASHTIICTSVISEGGYQLNGRPLSIGHDLGAPTTLPNDVTFKPLMSIRLKSSRLNAIVLPKTFTISPVQQSVFKYKIYTAAVTSGGSWVSAGANSSVEYNLAPTALVSGTEADTGFIISTNQSLSAPQLAATPFSYQLERNPFTNVAYEFVLMAATTGNGQTVYSSIGWEEIT